jgi:hypothetical protein
MQNTTQSAVSYLRFIPLFPKFTFNYLALSHFG